MSITEIARFTDVYEAEIAAARLWADGFDPVLGGAEHAKTNTLALLALGGVGLWVPNDQANRAQLLLKRLRAGAEQIEAAGPASPGRKAMSLSLIAAVLLGTLLVLAGWEHPPIFEEPPVWLDYW